jgi:hypothetical protein
MYSYLKIIPTSSTIHPLPLTLTPPPNSPTLPYLRNIPTHHKLHALIRYQGTFLTGGNSKENNLYPLAQYPRLILHDLVAQLPEGGGARGAVDVVVSVCIHPHISMSSR